MIFVKSLYGNATVNKVEINNRPLRAVYKLWKLDESAWNKIKDKDWRVFLSHIMGNCGYEITSHKIDPVLSGRSDHTVYLKPSVPDMVFFKNH